MVGQGRRRGAAPQRVPGGDLASRQGDRDGGQGGRGRAAARGRRSASASQRLKLQTDYGQAVMWGKGFAAEETKAAFARAGELATEIGNARGAARRLFRSLGAQLFSRRARVGPGSGRELPARGGTRGAADGGGGRASPFRIDSPRPGRFRAGARRIANRRCEFTIPSETAKPSSDSGWTLESWRPLIWLIAAWCLGEVARAAALMDEAVARAVESAHAPTLAGVYLHQAWLENLRDDAEAARRAAEAAVALSREHGLASYLAWAALPLAWARAKLGDRDAGSAELRQALADYASQGNKFYLPFYQGLLAEIEAEGEARKPPWPGSTKRWRWRARPESIGSTPDSTASAAKSSSNKTPPTPPPPKPPSSPPSPSRNSKKPAASSCAPRCRWPSSISPPAARSTPTTFWGRRWKAFRRRRSFRRSPRRRRCSRRSRRTRR